ncbi:MAG: glycosyltransferase family 2 protein [Ruminococcaceae bacterium]|nr:glycosyltransferase family 2 protein [Oscillospiraceae bacterium]
MSDCLYFVVPCYNDADTLPVSVPVFVQKLEALHAAGTISGESRLLLVNDGSSDGTWEVILALKKRYARITAVNLARNVGEQNALLAGMFTAVKKADCVITMDSDLQDDIGAVDEMLQRYAEGCDIVYGVHRLRREDAFSERFFAAAFYRLMRVARTGLIYQHANFRLMSKYAISLLGENRQTEYYLPCVVSNLGLKSAVVYHKRFERAAGQSGYSFQKKYRLAVLALLAHSAYPIQWLGTISAMGAAGSVLAGAGLVKTWQRQGKLSGGWSALCIALPVLTVSSAALCFGAAKKRKNFLKPIAAPRYTILEIAE